MLHKGMAVIIRDKDELEAFAQAADRKGYGSFIDIRYEKIFPIRISCNVRRENCMCLSRSTDIHYKLNEGITEVVEASDLFRNQLISMRRVKHGNPI